MKKRYPLLIVLIIVGFLIVLLGHVSATYNQVQGRIPQREMSVEYNCDYNYQVELNTEFFTQVDDLEMKNGYLGYNKLVMPVIDPPRVKGIFITGWLAGLEGKMNEYIELARETEINAFVIDIKDDTGTVTYNSSVPSAIEVKANRKKVKDIKALIKKIKKEDIYLIGRIVTFKDPIMAQAQPDRALKLKNATKNWQDDEWVNPYIKKNWDYAVDLAREALELGFDEIQFDYVRFPALGNGPTQIDYETEVTKERVINSFLSYAKRELAPYGAPISADIFGAVTSASDDLGIGQKLESISDAVDILSPMIYPSHYAHGVFKLPIPEEAPYETIYHSMSDAIMRLTKDHSARLRPWLQDFSLNYTYGAKEVKEQIQALNDLGIEEWLLWNPRSRYTEAALLPDGGEDVIAEKTEEAQDPQTEQVEGANNIEIEDAVSMITDIKSAKF